MTAIHWLNAVNGSFTNPSDWSGGAIPGASDDAILDAVGSSFTVTSVTDETVQSIQLASNATLSLLAGTFKAGDGTGSGANAGIILVGAGATLEVGGTVTNTGTIALDGSSGGAATLVIDFHVTTLTGGGEILLEGQGNDAIRHGGFATIDNIDNTIVGSGVITTAIVNYQNGTIDANGEAPLFIKGGIAQNAGLVEATGSGGLIFKNTFFDNLANGVVLVGAGSKIELIGAGASGGRFEGSGKLIAGTGAQFAGVDVPVIFDMNVDVTGQTIFTGTIQNNGTVSLSKEGSFEVTSTVNWEGNGVIDLSGRTMGEIGGPSASLTLASGTIEGSGSILAHAGYVLGLTLGTAGVVDGSAAASLTLNTNSFIVNAGTIESAGAGGVIDDDAIVNTGVLLVQDGGTFEVEGGVSGKGRAIIGGGTLEFLSSFNEAVTFTGSGTLELAQSQAFTNSVKGFSDKGKTTLDLHDIVFVDAGEATFSGTAAGGVLTVTDGAHTAHISLKGDYLGSTFVASSDGNGGTNVAVQRTQGASSPVLALVSAMAGLGAPVASDACAGEPRVARESMLSSPRIQVA